MNVETLLTEHSCLSTNEFELIQWQVASMYYTILLHGMQGPF